jgi:hypothetical protein
MVELKGCAVAQGVVGGAGRGGSHEQCREVHLWLAIIMVRLCGVVATCLIACLMSCGLYVGWGLHCYVDDEFHTHVRRMLQSGQFSRG